MNDTTIFTLHKSVCDLALKMLKSDDDWDDDMSRLYEHLCKMETILMKKLQNNNEEES